MGAGGLPWAALDRARGHEVTRGLCEVARVAVHRVQAGGAHAAGDGDGLTVSRQAGQRPLGLRPAVF